MLQSVADVIQALGSNTDGLSEAEIFKRRSQYGFNELPEKRRSLVLLFLRQFQDILVYILVGALVLSLLLPFLEEGRETVESFSDAFVILAILLLNAILGFFQEYRAEQAVALLRTLTGASSRVRREGKESIIPSREVVPGDIVILEAGDRIAADGRIFRASHFDVDESSLTGESRSAKKDTELLKQEVPLAEQRNMVFSGTLVTGGNAEIVITGIGTETEIGKIAKMVVEVQLPETPLQRKMQRLSKLIGAIVLGLCILLIGIGLLYGFTVQEIVLIGATLAVSAVPEGLPAVITICFAIGVRRMARKNALVRRLDALETLGSVNVICSDKTGTITRNRMTVVETWIDPTEHDGERLLALIAASNNRAALPNIGDPTEIALLRFAQDRGIERLIIDEEQVPFSAEAKYMQTRHGDRIFLKGAPEKILELTGNRGKEQVLAENERMAMRGLRVLAAAVQESGERMPHIIGLFGMEDPPREGVANAIAEAKRAGVRTIMITGDHAKTALAIARQVGIEGDVLQGKDLDALTPEELISRIQKTSVFARVSPTHKLTILEALKQHGCIVAMTGDGVNDAPAIKGAHVGIAMGRDGTQVAREAASIVLADDDYATIVRAIREGRMIYDNVRKFILFLLRSNFDEILFISTTLLLGFPLPYHPVHLLWI
ncbi:MAG: Ca2+-transporting ATPase, partial [Candidatus Peregrinibacteria bacterium Greene1014_49]